MLKGRTLWTVTFSVFFWKNRFRSYNKRGEKRNNYKNLKYPIFERKYNEKFFIYETCVFILMYLVYSVI